jgi:hypothetical protein
MKDCNKVKHTCGSIKGFATCIKYEKEVPQFSELFGNDCKDLEQVVEDLYNIVNKIKQDTDVTGLLNSCITFTTPKINNSVIEQMYIKICEMQAQITAQGLLIASLQE